MHAVNEHNADRAPECSFETLCCDCIQATVAAAKLWMMQVVCIMYSITLVCSNVILQAAQLIRIPSMLEGELFMGGMGSSSSRVYQS